MNLAASLQPLTLSQPDLEPSRLLMARTAQAEARFKAFDFSEPVFDTSAWLDTGTDDWSRVCYCEALFSTRFVLHVRFVPGTAEVAEVHAVQMSSRLERTELVHASQIQPGDIMLREGNHGEIREQVLAVSQRKFFVTFRVSCAGKEYDLTERTTKTVRRLVRTRPTATDKDAQWISQH